jgi:hypothetical protein
MADKPADIETDDYLISAGIDKHSGISSAACPENPSVISTLQSFRPTKPDERREPAQQLVQ